MTAMYETMLAERGSCESAATAKEAISLLKTKSFDLVLLDHHLPDATGLQLCKSIRRQFSQRVLPIIIITGTNDRQLEQQFWEAQCSDFVTKPFEASTLRHRVASHVKLKLAFDLLHKLSNQDENQAMLFSR